MTKLAKLGAPVGERLKAGGQSVAVAESSAGGLIAAALLAVPGASAYFKGGTVIYTRQSRYALLQTNREALAELPKDPASLAAHFAERARIVLDATWGIAELGIAGPTGSPYGHAAGTCSIAVSGPVSLTRTLETGDADREANMWRFAEAALALLEEALDRAPHSG